MKTILSRFALVPVWLLVTSPLATFADSNLCLEPPSRVEHPFFYEVTRGHQTAYILGTMHVGVPLAAMPEPVRHALDHATLGVGESHESNWVRRRFNQWRTNGAQRRFKEAPLSSLMYDDEYKNLVELLKLSDVPPPYVSRLSPAGAIVALNYSNPESRKGQLDNEIKDHLQIRHVPIIGLEPASGSSKALREIFNISELRAELPVLRHNIAESCRVYWTGDEETLREKADTIDFDSAKQRRLVVFRNQAWIPEIEKVFGHSARPFFFFGIAHLYGQQGVLHLLEQRGFTIKRVN